VRSLVTNALATRSCTKAEKTNIFFLFLSQATVFLTLDSLFPNTLYTHVLVFAVRCAEARDMPTLSRVSAFYGKRLPLKGISFNSQKPFTLTIRGTRGGALSREEFPACT
jgi:hypothetical protein